MEIQLTCVIPHHLWTKKIYEKCGNIRVSQSHLRKSCRVRNREPSRVALKRIIKSLKIRKSRAKCKRFIRMTVPVSSVLYSIVSNFKQWNITFAKKQDSFFSNSVRNSALWLPKCGKSIILCVIKMYLNCTWYSINYYYFLF